MSPSTRTRLVGFALLVAAEACASPRARVRAADEEDGAFLRARPDVTLARQLDQEGVRSFRDGRYADAVRYFRSAARLGGPSTELWNIARSREQLDDAEGALASLDEYLARPDLTAADRAEAAREARALRARPSMLTVTTNPAAATVLVDDKPAIGATPVSVEIAAGAHTLSIRRAGYVAETRPIMARFGRAVIVSLDLVRAPK